MTSLTANRPPGLSTRNASASTRRLSPERLMTQLEMMTSTVFDGSGIASMWPLRNSTFVAPGLRACSRARARASRRSCRAPYALPVGPTRFAESSTSMPPPEPRSSTVSPSRSSASAVGLPQPSDASSASAGRPAVFARVVQVRGDRVPRSRSWTPQQPLEPLGRSRNRTQPSVRPRPRRRAARPAVGSAPSRGSFERR